MTAPDINCNLCGRSRFDILEEDQAPFRVLKCKNCSLVFVRPQPEAFKLEDHYDEAYYSEWIHIQKKSRIRMWAKRLEKLSKYQAGGRLLDVGCGEGAFLRLAQQRGWQISGTELSSYAANYSSQVLDTELFCGDLPNAAFPENSFDVVTIWHVLEHVSNPRQYLLEIRRILKPKGLLVVAVPNVNDLIMQIAYRIVKGRKMKLFSKDEKEVHLYHFSTKTLKLYLEATGFKCLKLSPDYGIIEPSKKLINMIAVVASFLTGMKIFNAIEAHAVPKSEVSI